MKLDGRRGKGKKKENDYAQTGGEEPFLILEDPSGILGALLARVSALESPHGTPKRSSHSPDAHFFFPFFLSAFFDFLLIYSPPNQYTSTTERRHMQ